MLVRRIDLVKMKGAGILHAERQKQPSAQRLAAAKPVVTLETKSRAQHRMLTP